ncbi:MAG: ATP-binding protein [Gallionella sp.]
MNKWSALLKTPAGVVVAVGFIVLVSELLIMALINSFQAVIPKDAFLEKLFLFLDPVALTAIVSPALYLLVFRPLKQQAELERQAKNALRAIALKHQLLFESSRDALMLLTPPSWKFTGANQATLQLFGAASVDEFTALGPLDVSPERQPDGRLSSEKAQEMIAIAMREGAHFLEWQHRRLDGQPFVADVLLTRMEVDEGVFLQASVRDISERKQLEQQLSRRLRHLDVMERISRISLHSASIEELLERVLDEILAVFDADRAWFLYPCDPDAPSWSVPMERARPEWPGAFVRGMVMPMTPEVAEIMRETLASAEPLPYGPAASRRIPAAVAEQFSIRSQMQMALRPRVGSPWVMGLHHCAQAHVYGEDELLIFNDIGQRVADVLSVMIMLKNLREAQDALVRNEKLALLGQVAGSVGHELRNPLGVMSNAVYFLQAVLSDADDSVKEYLGIIKNEIAVSERMASDLMDAVSTRPPHPEAVGVAELIGRILRKYAMPPSVSVQLEIPGMLPLLWVDVMQMDQLFNNLVSNGVEAMPEGGVLEIRAIENKPDGTVIISVRDSGIGMTPEQMSKLFQPLFTTKARGIGLGLVVVKNLTEANGGRVEVQSEAGKGSAFFVTLPAAVRR